MPTSRSYVIAAAVPSSAPVLPMTPVSIARNQATNSAPTTLPSSTRPKLRTTSRTGTRPASALIGTSSMLPVSRLEPATSTSTSPRVKAMPVNSVGSVPQISGSRPDETTTATIAPKEM